MKDKYDDRLERVFLFAQSEHADEKEYLLKTVRELIDRVQALEAKVDQNDQES